MNYNQFLEIADDASDSYLARALYAQAALETDNFQSNLMVTDWFNLFGMRPSHSRPQYYSSVVNHSGGEFAAYDDLWHSILDRLNWDDYFGLERPKTDLDIKRYYADVALKGYAEADYNERLWNRYRMIFKWDYPLHSELLETVGTEFTVIRPHSGDRGNGGGFGFIALLTIVTILIFLFKRKSKNVSE